MAADPRCCAACLTPLALDASFCPSCGTATPTRVLDESPSPFPVDPASLQAALTPHFEVRDVIGVGGFGTVFRAWDQRLSRLVAVKVLRRDIASSAELRDRFRREAQAAAALNHPHILAVHDVGEHGGLLYIVMPHVEGHTLRDELRSGVPDPHEALRILREVADALAYAHERGIVHRDLKPENVLLEGVGRRALLGDFGIAKFLHRAGSGATASGLVLGTPLYMSPEQASGSSDVDQRTDVYAFGALAYEVLTGSPPFRGQTAIDVLLAQTAGPPAHPSLLRGDIPQALGDLVLQCLNADPGRRPHDGSALFDALRATALPPRTPALLARRSRVSLLVGGAGLLTFIALRPIAFPVPSRAAVSESEVVRIAADFLGRQGATGAYDESVLFHSGSGRGFLQRVLGAAAAARWMDSVLPPEHWHVRWQQRGGPEHWMVAVSGRRITEFAHTTVALGGGRRLEAKPAAEAFLQRLRRDPSGLVFAGATQRRSETSVETDLAWDDTAAAIVYLAADGTERSVVPRATVAVGDRGIVAYAYRLDVPAAQAAAGRDAVRVAGAVFAFVVLGTAVFVAIQAVRSERPRWRYALVLGAVAALATGLDGLGQLGGQRWDFAGTADADVRMAAWIGTFAMVALMTGLLVTGLTAAGPVLGRMFIPSMTDAPEGIRQQRRAAGFVFGAIGGCVVIGFDTVFFALINVTEGANGWAGEGEFTWYLSRDYPIASYLGYVVSHALFVGSAITVGWAAFRKLLRSTAVAGLVMAAFAGLVFIRVSPVSLGFFESLGTTVILLGALWYGGPAAVIVAEVVFLSLLQGSALLASTMAELVLPGIVLIAVAALTPVVGYVASSGATTPAVAR